MRFPIFAKFSAGTTKVLFAALLAISNGSLAAMFEHTPPQQLVTGETLSVVLRLSSESTQQTNVSIVDPKVNMTLTRMTKNKYLLRWDSPELLPAEQIITVQASVLGPRTKLEKHHIVVRSSQIRQSSSTLSATRTPGDRLSLLKTGRHTKPRITGIPTQIISAGQTVKFRVIATIENGRNADISVDRLPPNARIDTDFDGVPIFIWKTESTDRGEHELLFIATHPSMPDLQDTTEAYVIIEYSNASAASAITAASDAPQTLEELAHSVDALPPLQKDDEMAPEGVKKLADPYQSPSDYPTDGPPDYPTDGPPDYPTDGPPDYPTDGPPDYPTDGPPDYPTDGPPDYPTDGPADYPTDSPVNKSRSRVFYRLETWHWIAPTCLAIALPIFQCACSTWVKKSSPFCRHVHDKNLA